MTLIGQNQTSTMVQYHGTVYFGEYHGTTAVHLWYCEYFFVPPPEGGQRYLLQEGGSHSTHTARERALKRGGAEFRAAAAPPHPFA